MNILIVEDDMVNQTILKGILNSIGYKDSQLANDAKQAWDLIEKGEPKFDIILMDLGLPDISGIDLTKKIRQSSLPAKNVPIIAVTGNSEAKSKAESLAAGMNAFLTKPVDPKLLETTLKTILAT